MPSKYIALLECRSRNFFSLVSIKIRENNTKHLLWREKGKAVSNTSRLQFQSEKVLIDTKKITQSEPFCEQKFN